MSGEPLHLCLESETRPGLYRLSFGTVAYPITLNPETSFTFSDGLRCLEQVLAGNNSMIVIGSDFPDLLRELGMWLWRSLLPESAPSQEREALAKTLHDLSL